MPARWERELLHLRRAPVPLEEMRERAQQPPRLGPAPRTRRERVIARAVALAVFIGLAAFGWQALSSLGDGPAGVGNVPPPLSNSPVSLWLSAERVAPGPVELVAMLVDHEGVDATFGVHATVDRWDGREWVSYGELVMCMDHWHCTAQIQSQGGVGVPDIGLGPRLGSPGPVERFTTDGLDVGWYRISQIANEGVVASAILEIAADAPATTPLVSVDVPAISVSPALEATAGGEVFLYPLIPTPPSGSQSREDIQRAIAGLSETAAIERWDGSKWERVGRVELSPGGDSLARTAQLPALPQGAYRLVREGPNGAHVGHFWVTQAI